MVIGGRSISNFMIFAGGTTSNMMLFAEMMLLFAGRLASEMMLLFAGRLASEMMLLFAGRLASEMMTSFPCRPPLQPLFGHTHMNMSTDVTQHMCRVQCAVFSPPVSPWLPMVS